MQEVTRLERLRFSNRTLGLNDVITKMIAILEEKRDALHPGSSNGD